MPEINPPKVQPKCACKPNQSRTSSIKTDRHLYPIEERIIGVTRDTCLLCGEKRPDSLDLEPYDLEPQLSEQEEAAYSTRNLKYPDPSEKDGKSNEEAEELIRKFLSDREEAFKLVEMMRSIPAPEEAAYSTRNLKYPDPSEVEGKVDDRIFRCLAFSLIMAIVSFVLGFLWK
jgi:hypothetical protein